MRILTNFELRKCKICGKKTHPTGKRKSDGAQRRHPDLCTKHHQEDRAKENGFDTYAKMIYSNAGFDSSLEYQDHAAKLKGFTGVTAHRNSTHRWRKFKKDYCENVDGRLGFKCSYTKKQWHSKIGKMLEVTGVLEVDHIIPKSKGGEDTEENTQTLCCNCHQYKTVTYKDSSPKSEVVMELVPTKKKGSIKYARQKNEPWRMLEERCIEKESSG